MKKKWTKEEIELLNNNYNFKTKEELLEIFPDRNWSSITKYASSKGIARRNLNSELNFVKNVGKNNFKKYSDFTILYVSNPTIGIVKVKIDTNELDYVLKHKWNCKKDKSGKYYIRSSYNIGNGKRKELLLHRYISKPKNNQVVDHLNGNTYDNRKSNLLNTTPEGNGQNIKYSSKNKTGIRGVCKKFERYNNKYVYMATVQYNRVKVFSKKYNFDKNGLKQAETDVKFARAYIHDNSPEAREINKKDIPEWIKTHIDNKINNKNNKSFTKPRKINHKNKHIQWSNDVMSRDNFTCKCCNINAYDSKIKLNSHHIVPFSEDKNLRHDINNGITVCQDCHNYTHKQGSKIINYLQWFIENENKIKSIC